jgi:Cu2+-exporting ATPase
MTIAAERFSTTLRVEEACCAHCGLPVPAGLIEPSAEHQFCCAGCDAVFQTLHSCGLEAYYRLRELGDVAPRAARPTESAFQSFDSPTFHGLYVQERPDGLCCADLALEGITCAACVWLVERLPRVLDGVIEARLSLREATVRVTWDRRKLPLSRVGQALDRLGYTPHPARDELAREIHRREARRRMIHLGVAGAIMGNTMLLALALYAGSYGQMEEQYRMFFRWLSAGLASISLAWPGSTFFRSAWAALRMRTTNLDVPISLALLVGGVAGLVNVVLNRGEIYFDSLTVLTFLLLVGRFIQYRQQRWADDAVGLLFNLTPSSCRVVRGDEVIEVPVEALHERDVIEVRAGELFPADGVVREGKSTVNQALLTGESMPTPILAGDSVHAGAQNVGSVVRVVVEKIGRDTRVGKLVGLIERGVLEKPKIQQFADRVGGIFTVVVSIIAAAVFAFWCRHSLALAIDHTVALLIVTCPCVLGLATPLALAMAIGGLARRDILVKSGAALERLSGRGRLMLDKTGTLTEGRLRMIEWVGDESWKPLVNEIERNSNHPVGRALFEATPGVAGILPPPVLRGRVGERAVEGRGRATEPPPQPSPGIPGEGENAVRDVIERGDGGLSAVWQKKDIFIGSPIFVSRKGITPSQSINEAIERFENSGLTAIVLAVAGQTVAAAGLGDRVRHDSRRSVQVLRQSGWQPQILSGDAREVAKKVAEQVGIDDAAARGALSPEQKLSIVTERKTKDVTVMVGDGVNDAAALAAADVGIAVHGGAEASLSAADVYIARPGLEPLVELVHTSRRTMRVIRRNLAVSLGYNVLAAAAAAAGWMTPLHAAILMPISSVSVLALTVVGIAGRRGTRFFSKQERVGV